MSQWTLFSNHGHVLVVLSRDPDARLRDVAAVVGITERAVQKIVRDLQDAGMLSVTKQGRRNQYQLHGDQPLRHALEAHCTVGELMGLVNEGLEHPPDQAHEEKALPPAKPAPQPASPATAPEPVAPQPVQRVARPPASSPAVMPASHADAGAQVDDQRDVEVATRSPSGSSAEPASGVKPEAAAAPVPPREPAASERPLQSDEEPGPEPESGSQSRTQSQASSEPDKEKKPPRRRRKPAPPEGGDQGSLF